MSLIDLLISLKSKEDVKRMFIEHLNYSHSSGSVSSSLSDKLRKEIITIEKIAEQNQFFIIYCRLPVLLKGSERPISEQLSKTFAHNLIIFTNKNEREFHFTNLKYIEKKKELIKTPHRPFRRIVVGSFEKLRTASERIQLLKIENENESALQVNLKCEHAFDVEAVSRNFYNDYVHFYKEFRKYLLKRNKRKLTTTDDNTQTIFNRIFFLYFVQKKGYLQKYPDFIYNNFKNIKNKNYYQDFLIPLFEKISNNIRSEKFQNIPFLNGGLFEFTEDEKKIKISNDIFKIILKGLFEKYNFTVREDTEFEREVAIDPEMLGTIFERLILGLEKNKYKDIPDARRASGSYYTPKFIVSFMVKQSLLNDLVNDNTIKIIRYKLKELVFNLKTEQLSVPELITIRKRLLDIRIVDPAVGSGAYPVGILLKIVEIIEVIDNKINPQKTDKKNYRYNLKRDIIENCIYGVDLQPKAVHLTNLRLWLSLIVDLDVDHIEQIPPLPNLDFHIYEGDSLVSQIAGYDFDTEKDINTQKPEGKEILNIFSNLKKQYEKTADLNEKEKQKTEIENVKGQLIKWFLTEKKKEIEQKLEKFATQQIANIEGFEQENEIDFRDQYKKEITVIENKINQAESYTKKFNWGLDFIEIETQGGFDIVIANPPYGIKVPTKTRDEFKLNSKDSYGVFVSLGLKILKPGGTLCYIMSDTWQTIKSHKNLRDQLLKETDAQFLISVPADTFGATVNTGVYTFIKRISPRWRLTEKADNRLIAADLSPFKIKQPNGSWDTGNLEAGFELLTEQNDFDETKDGYTLYSERDFAVFAYKQKLIPRFSNHSFFIASPKLFKLMEDTGKHYLDKDGKTIYQVEFNGKELEMVKLGDNYLGSGKKKQWKENGLFKIVSGIKTGCNEKYLRCIDYCQKNFDMIEKLNVLNEIEINNISSDEKRNGIKSNDRYFISFEMGKPAEAQDGLLPQYYQSSSNIVINWSKQAVSSMKKEKHSDLANDEFRFIDYRNNISISMTGQYAPTFRISVTPVFVNASSRIICNSANDNLFLLGVLNSKFMKFLFKSVINHSVGVEIDNFKISNFLKIYSNDKIYELVELILFKQKQNPKYDYMTNEQIEIDKLVYQMYNLNEEDIKEVENWYWRRYPKLAEAIERNMKAKQNQAASNEKERKQ